MGGECQTASHKSYSGSVHALLEGIEHGEVVDCTDSMEMGRNGCCCWAPPPPQLPPPGSEAWGWAGQVCMSQRTMRIGVLQEYCPGSEARAWAAQGLQEQMHWEIWEYFGSNGRAHAKTYCCRDHSLPQPPASGNEGQG